MVMARVNQYFNTLNTANDSLYLPSVVMNDVFSMKQGLPEGYDFVLFSPEDKPLNMFGMVPALRKKPVTLFDSPPEDPVSVFFYTPKQLTMDDVFVNMLEDNQLTMISKFNIETIVRKKTHPWWLFTWV